MNASRIPSLDILRGVVMVLMALDHVRVYSGLPAGGLTPSIFFTRWVTHFCAPAFVFLAGTAAFLYGKKVADAGVLTRYLLTRGLLLVLLELTVIRFAWTFNFDYRQFTLAGVIWMLGWCMVLLAGLVKLPAKTVGVIGFVIVFFEQTFRFPPQLLSPELQKSIGWIWEFVYPSDLKNSSGIQILYVLVPWVGVMALGYAFGEIMLREPGERRRLGMRIGLSATVIFLIAASVKLFLIPAPADAPPIVLRLLDQQKYPASQLYLLMTLGPAITFLALFDHASSWWLHAFETMGRVPMFYYLLHIPLIHLAALVVMRVSEGQFHQAWYATAPFTYIPRQNRWSLALLYLVWAVVIAVLFAACRWFAAVKARHPDSWLKYI